MLKGGPPSRPIGACFQGLLSPEAGQWIRCHPKWSCFLDIFIFSVFPVDWDLQEASSFHCIPSPKDSPVTLAVTSPKMVEVFLNPCQNTTQQYCCFMIVFESSHSKAKRSWDSGLRGTQWKAVFKSRATNQQKSPDNTVSTNGCLQSG